MKRGKWSIWFGKIPINCWFPKYSYFNGGCYEKKALLWLGWILEFSREKIDNVKYQNISRKELNEILSELSQETQKIKASDKKYRDKYYD